MTRDKSQHVFSCVRSPQGDGLADEETKAGSNRRKVASLEAMVQWMIYLSLTVTYEHDFFMILYVCIYICVFIARPELRCSYVK